MLFFCFLKSNLSKLSEEHIITAVNLLHMYINTKHSFHSYVLKKELLAREKKTLRHNKSPIYHPTTAIVNVTKWAWPTRSFLN